MNTKDLKRHIMRARTILRKYEKEYGELERREHCQVLGALLTVEIVKELVNHGRP